MLVEQLKWDSSFFGVPIGRIVMGTQALTERSLDRALAEAVSKKIRCIYFEMPFGLPNLLDYCSKNRFTIVDFKTKLSKEIDEGSVFHNDTNITDKTDRRHLAGLLKIADTISRRSRYACDKRFGYATSRRFYREWLKNSYYHNYCDSFLTYQRSGLPVGFISLKIKQEEPYIDLLGVSGKEQARGIGAFLIRSAEKVAFGMGYRRISVVTQGHNVAALRAYQKIGFRVENVSVFYHKWLDL